MLVQAECEEPLAILAKKFGITTRFGKKAKTVLIRLRVSPDASPAAREEAGREVAFTTRALIQP